MRKRRHVIGYLFGMALTLAGLTSAATAQSTAPKRNGKIAFVRQQNENSGISVMNPDGSGRAQLTFTQILCPQPNRPAEYGCGPDQLDYSPAWSPDGQQIAFVRSVLVPDFRYDAEIFVMNADGSDQRRLTPLGTNVESFSRPAWSPDGTKIAFVGVLAGSYYSHIYTMNADGSDRRPIVMGSDPAWSPDGSKLAISFGGIYLMNPDGSGGTQITAPKNPSPNLVDYDWGPAWSPDGTRIIFIRSVGCDWDDSCESINIWTVNADGSNPAKAADIAAYGRLAWSPDGTKIVFSTNGDLFTMEADGSNVTNITNTPDEGEWLPSWQAVALAPPPVNPIDDPQFFVRQQYLDFLNREPEQSGLDDWMNFLNNCPAGDLVCLHEHRLTASADFFGSPEFQLKGYFVFRFYRTAFDRLPAYDEIAPDMQSVTGQTPGEVYQKKADFTNSFVQRPEFANSLGTLSNTNYVAALLNRYQLTSVTTPDPGSPDGTNKVTLSQFELVSRLDATTLTRAQVLRAIADSDEVLAAEINRAFVAMQYYGYLRRTPEQKGYNEWLRYLTDHPTDFREMVRGFVDSVEYRRRFGRP